jgi:hypothetical protein
LSNQALGIADQADANNPYLKLYMQAQHDAAQVASAGLSGRSGGGG